MTLVTHQTMVKLDANIGNNFKPRSKGGAGDEGASEAPTHLSNSLSTIHTTNSKAQFGCSDSVRMYKRTKPRPRVEQQRQQVPQQQQQQHQQEVQPQGQQNQQQQQLPQSPAKRPEPSMSRIDYSGVVSGVAPRLERSQERETPIPNRLVA